MNEQIYKVSFGHYRITIENSTIFSAVFDVSNHQDTQMKSLESAIQDLQQYTLSPSGTPFQKDVWNALVKIPYGTVVSYQEIAQAIQNPKAVRAVATAIANNPIAYLIPCHRVIRKNGDLGGYRWGSKLKKDLLKWEQHTKITGGKKYLELDCCRILMSEFYRSKYIN